jgi:drug/metabolite transporter (DMT)-like permease
MTARPATAGARAGTGPLSSPYVLLTLTTLFWAGNITLGKVAALGHVPPFTLSFLRWTMAALILLPFGLRHIVGQWPEYRRHWGKIVAPGLLGITAYNTLQYWALNHTTSINAAVIGAAMPGGIFLLTFLLGQERARGWQIVGMGLLTAGIVYVAVRGSLGVLAALAFNVGDVAMIVAVILFCFYSVLLRRIPPGFAFTGLLTALIIVGALGVLPFAAWETATQPPLSLTWVSLGIILYVGLFPSVFAYYCWNRAIALAGANLAGVMMSMTTVFVVVMGVTLLGEPFHLYHAIGFALIFGGLVLAVAAGRRARG